MNTRNRTTAKVNRVIELIETKNITQTGAWVADQLGLKQYAVAKRNDPWWKRYKESTNWCTQRGKG